MPKPKKFFLYNPIFNLKIEKSIEELSNLFSCTRNYLYVVKKRKTFINNKYFLVKQENKSPKALYNEYIELIDLSNEKWKRSRLKPDYLVSNRGRVKSIKTGNIILPNQIKGTNSLTLVNEKGIRGTNSLAKLIAYEFVEGYKEGKIISHIINKWDDTATNLYWTDRSKLAAKTNISKGKEVAKIDPLTNEILDTYSTCREAARLNYCSSHHISRTLKGNGKALGYIWKEICNDEVIL